MCDRLTSSPQGEQSADFNTGDFDTRGQSRTYVIKYANTQSIIDRVTLLRKNSVR